MCKDRKVREELLDARKIMAVFNNFPFSKKESNFCLNKHLREEISSFLHRLRKSVTKSSFGKRFNKQVVRKFYIFQQVFYIFSCDVSRIFFYLYNLSIHQAGKVSSSIYIECISFNYQSITCKVFPHYGSLSSFFSVISSANVQPSILGILRVC